MTASPAAAFSLPALLADAPSGWTEFFHQDSLSMGLYTLEAGGSDPQGPHREDEVYLVLEGQATLDVEGEPFPVTAGSVVYVEAHARHSFHDIRERLRVLVFFAPGETAPTLPEEAN